MYLYIFDATEVSEVCYYADPIPSVELTPGGSSGMQRVIQKVIQIVHSDIPWTMEDRHCSIDAKLKELQQTTTTRQSTLIDSGMEIGPPSMFPRKSTSPVRSVYTPSRGSV